MHTNIPFLFICQIDDDDSIRIATKLEVDNQTQWAADNGQDINFKIIGKVPANITVDFPPSLITWYEENEKEKPFVDNVIMKLINYIF